MRQSVSPTSTVGSKKKPPDSGEPSSQRGRPPPTTAVAPLDSASRTLSSTCGDGGAGGQGQRVLGAEGLGTEGIRGTGMGSRGFGGSPRKGCERGQRVAVVLQRRPLQPCPRPAPARQPHRQQQQNVRQQLPCQRRPQGNSLFSSGSAGSSPSQRAHPVDCGRRDERPLGGAWLQAAAQLHRRHALRQQLHKRVVHPLLRPRPRGGGGV
jgi:hypothetical protein